MGFSWGSFADGAADGISNGVGIAAKLQMMNEAARKRKEDSATRAALGRTYASDVPMGSIGADAPAPVAPMPGQASVPSMPGQASTPNDDYAAMAAPPPPNDDYAAMAAAPPSNGLSGMPSGGAPLPPPTGAPLPPPNMAPSPDGPATGTGGVPLSSTAAPIQPQGPQDPAAAVTNTIQDANNTIKSIAHAIKQANPGIDPEALFAATAQHIETMKGVRNEVKDYMTAQAHNADLQFKQQKLAQHMEELIARMAGAGDVQDKKNEGALAVAGVRGETARDVGAGHDNARRDSAQIGADARVTASGNAAMATISAATIRKAGSDQTARSHVYSTVYAAMLKAGVNEDTARIAANARVDAAIAQAGGTPPERGLRPGGSAPAAPKPAAGGYKTPADVKAAYTAGKIDRATAASVLKNQFGMQ